MWNGFSWHRIQYRGGLFRTHKRPLGSVINDGNFLIAEQLSASEGGLCSGKSVWPKLFEDAWTVRWLQFCRIHLCYLLRQIRFVILIVIYCERISDSTQGRALTNYISNNIFMLVSVLTSDHLHSCCMHDFTNIRNRTNAITAVLSAADAML